MERFIQAINAKLANRESLYDYIPEVLTFIPPEAKAPYLLLTLYDHMPKEKGGYFKAMLVLYNRSHGQVERLKLLTEITQMMAEEFLLMDQTFMAKLLSSDYALGEDNLTQKTTLTYHIKYQKGETHGTI